MSKAPSPNKLTSSVKCRWVAAAAVRACTRAARNSVSSVAVVAAGALKSEFIESKLNGSRQESYAERRRRSDLFVRKSRMGVQQAIWRGGGAESKRARPFQWARQPPVSGSDLLPPLAAPTCCPLTGFLCKPNTRFGAGSPKMRFCPPAGSWSWASCPLAAGPGLPDGPDSAA